MPWLFDLSKTCNINSWLIDKFLISNSYKKISSEELFLILKNLMRFSIYQHLYALRIIMLDSLLLHYIDLIYQLCPNWGPIYNSIELFSWCVALLGRRKRNRTIYKSNLSPILEKRKKIWFENRRWNWNMKRVTHLMKTTLIKILYCAQ